MLEKSLLTNKLAYIFEKNFSEKVQIRSYTNATAIQTNYRVRSRWQAHKKQTLIVIKLEALEEVQITFHLKKNLEWTVKRFSKKIHKNW